MAEYSTTTSRGISNKDKGEAYGNFASIGLNTVDERQSYYNKIILEISSKITEFCNEVDKAMVKEV